MKLIDRIHPMFKQSPWHDHSNLEILNLFQDNFDRNQPLLEGEAQIENYFDLVSPLNVRNII